MVMVMVMVENVVEMIFGFGKCGARIQIQSFFKCTQCFMHFSQSRKISNCPFAKLLKLSLLKDIFYFWVLSFPPFFENLNVLCWWSSTTTWLVGDKNKETFLGEVFTTNNSFSDVFSPLACLLLSYREIEILLTLDTNYIVHISTGLITLDNKLC